MPRITVDLNEELFRSFSIKCARMGVKKSEVIRKLIAKFVNEDSTEVFTDVSKSVNTEISNSVNTDTSISISNTLSNIPNTVRELVSPICNNEGCGNILDPVAILTLDGKPYKWLGKCPSCNEYYVCEFSNVNPEELIEKWTKKYPNIEIKNWNNFTKKVKVLKGLRGT